MIKLINLVIPTILLVYLPLVMIPATAFWYSPGVVLFSDTTLGKSPELSFYREIKRDSFIEYSVVVRDENGRVACDASGGPFRYQKQEGVLVDVTLAEWAPSDPRCRLLPVGSYWVETTWKVVRPLGDFLPTGDLEEMIGGIIPPKYVTRLSPVFHINPSE